MSLPENWGDDLAEQLPPEERANYLKWRARIRAQDENDEIICIAGYLDALTKIWLSITKRMEHMVRMIAGRKMAFDLGINIWFFAMLVMVAMLCIVVVQLLRTEHEMDSIREQFAHQIDQQAREQREVLALVGENSDILIRLTKSGVRLHCFDRTYPDGNKGFVLWSNWAFNAGLGKSEDGQPAGVLYFRYPPASDLGGP